MGALSMQLLNINKDCSYAADSDPMVLGRIFDEEISVALWCRENQQTVASYFDNVFQRLGMGLRGIFSLGSLKAELEASLPDAKGRAEAIDDIFLLSDMLTTLFNCDSVGLRLAPLDAAMCPKLHADNIPVRLVSTYLGEGTQWLPQERLVSANALQPNASNTLGTHKHKLATSLGNVNYRESDIMQMSSFDVGLLKGKAWPEQEESAALHRSCPVSQGAKRVLLTLDPM
jgi:hypothetical protein